MATWFETIASPLRTASESAKKLIEIRDEVKIGKATVELYAQITAAYEAAFAIKEREAALSEENETLKKRVAELEAKKARLENYERTELPPGVFVRAPKPGTEESKKPHYACETCYERGKISSLHASERQNGIQRLTCNECGTTLKTGFFQPPPPIPFRTRPLRRRG